MRIGFCGCGEGTEVGRDVVSEMSSLLARRRLGELGRVLCLPISKVFDTECTHPCPFAFAILIIQRGIEFP
jgi:hypothetical protein